MRGLIPVVILLNLVFASAAFASPDESQFEMDQIDPSTSGPTTAPLFNRQLAVYDYYKVPAEPDSQTFVDDLQSAGSMTLFQKRIKLIDPANEYARFITWGTAANGDRILNVYRDRDSKTALDFQINVRAGDGGGLGQLPVPAFYQNVRAAKSNSPSIQLSGLRIALDPGHMGSSVWDDRTGKFVKDSKGNKVSEGVINLQTAMLLADRLRSRGAEVMLTHTTLAPVTTETWQGIDMNQYFKQELLQDSLYSWFQNLLGTSDVGPKLFQAFDSSSGLLRIKKEFMRSKFFILESDLSARVDKMAAFSPDITVIIHYDVDDSQQINGINPFHYSKTKAFVAGDMGAVELSTRRERWETARHLVTPYQYEASLDLGRSITKSIHQDLGIDFDTSTGPGGKLIEPGLIARNLSLSRQMMNSVVSYVECLYYNDPNEFAQMLDARNPMLINGVQTPYSNRVGQVAAALEKGIVNYVQNVQ